MATADESDDDERVWRCKECGTRQPTPEPPCERCWNTTFVSGDGADGVAGGSETATLSPSAVQAAQVRIATRRSAGLSALLTVVFAALYASLSLGSAVEGLVFLALVSTGGATVLFVAVALFASIAYGGEPAPE